MRLFSPKETLKLYIGHRWGSGGVQKHSVTNIHWLLRPLEWKACNHKAHTHTLYYSPPYLCCQLEKDWVLLAERHINAKWLILHGSGAFHSCRGVRVINDCGRADDRPMMGGLMLSLVRCHTCWILPWSECKAQCDVPLSLSMFF